MGAMDDAGNATADAERSDRHEGALHRCQAVDGGDGQIHVVAPSGPVPAERLARGLAHVRRRYGAPTLARNLDARSGYFAGADALRLDSLRRALLDDEARVLWAARGGYGATRLLERLDPELLRRRPKLIVGFSDISALLCWALATGVPAIHGPVVAQLGELGPDDLQRLDALLRGELPAPLVAADGASVITGGRVEGRLIAANLEVLRSLLGTPWFPPLRGAILALEEVGERPYRIDRALTQLLTSGALRGVRGVAFGQLHGCREPENGGSQGASAREVVEERLARLGVPLLIGLPFGHAPAANAALPVGVAARLDADQGALALLAPVAATGSPPPRSRVGGP